MADSRWRVVNSQQMADLRPDGTFEDVFEVTFQMLATGQIGKIKVSLRNYTPDFVAAEVQQMADRMAAVADLTGG